MSTHRTLNKTKLPGYQLSRDYVLDLFPHGRAGAMAFADMVTAQGNDDRFSKVANEYRRLRLRERSAVSLEKLCDKAGIEPRDFTNGIIACAVTSGMDMSAVLDVIVNGPVQFLNRITVALGTGAGAQAARFRLLEESGLFF